MSIKQLQEYVGQANIAKDVSDEKLELLGQRVKRQYDEDLESMSDWLKGVVNGIELMKQEWETKSTPWEGASNYKDPLLTQAAMQFGDKAVLELLRSKDLVTADIVGRDASGEKQARADRVTEAMNYQVNHDMNDWRGGQERVLYALPTPGALFKKTIHDPIEQNCESVLIQYPDFVVNQATTSMEACRSFSHVLDFNRNEVEVKVRSGRWLDVDLWADVEGDDKQGDEGGNEEAKVQDSIDNPDKFIEQQCYFDLDDDGYEEPYIVTIHHNSCKVVRIVARFDENSIVVKVTPEGAKDGKVMPLPKALELRTEEEIQGFGGINVLSLIGLNKPEPDPDKLELLKIVPFQQVTDYRFFNAPDGTFLGLGYAHLLGAITQALNTSTNQLTDRATLNNVGGGFLSKEFRKEMGINRLKIGQWVKTQVPADKFATGMMPNPTGEPSQTLFSLNEKMEQKGQQFLSIADISGQINAQTAPTTALAIIQEGSIPTSALFKRILKAESNEFQILYRLNQRTFDEEDYKMILDDPNADARADFNSQGLNVIPTANAEMSSKMHRIQTAQIEMEQVPLVLQAGGNPLPIIKGFLEAIGSDKIEQIFPEEGTMTPEEKAQIAKMTKAQEMANQIQQMQLDLLTREQDRLDSETIEKNKKISQEIRNLQADLLETLAKAAKAGEEAESESLNNQITTYTASLERNLDALLGVNNVRSIAESPALQAPRRIA